MFSFRVRERQVGWAVSSLFVLVFVMGAKEAACENTNLEVLGLLYRSAADEFIQTVTCSDSLIALKSLSPDLPYNWLIKTSIFKVFNSSCDSNLFEENGPDSTIRHATLEYKSVDQKIEYRKVAKTKFARECRISVYFRFIDSSKRIIENEIIHKVHADTIKKRDIAKIENMTQPFTSGEKKNSFPIGIIEPVMISLLTGLVIYLFYSYRSQ